MRTLGRDYTMGKGINTPDEDTMNKFKKIVEECGLRMYYWRLKMILKLR